VWAAAAGKLENQLSAGTTKDFMSEQLPAAGASNTFERIKRVNASGAEFWSARELARVLAYTDFRNFISVINKAREACDNSGHKVSDHFVDITEMVGIGSGAWRPIEDWALSRYACYLVIQNADPGKPLVALGQTYFAVQTRRQERADEEVLKEGKTRLLLRAEIKKHIKNLEGVAKQAGVSGGTNSSLTLTGITFFQAGDYTLTASNPIGFITSTNAKLTVLSGPVLTNGSFETGSAAGWVLSDISSPVSPLAVHGAGFNDGFGFFSSAPTDGNFCLTHGFDGNGPGRATPKAG